MKICFVIAGLMLAGCAEKCTLPQATFDAGGTTFDLERISAARFTVPEGGQTGVQERTRASDPRTPTIVTVDWKNCREPKPRTLSLRYRLRVDALPQDSKPDILLPLRRVKIMPDGSHRTIENGSRIRLQDTAGTWQEMCFPNVWVPNDADALDIPLDLNGALGKFEVKDVTLRHCESPAGKDNKYLVDLQLTPMSYGDGTFALATGQPNVMYFTWKSINYHRKYDAKAWQVRFDLPAGVRCRAIVEEDSRNFHITTNANGSTTVCFDTRPDVCPKGIFHHWFRSGMVLMTDLAAGTQPGIGVYHAFYKGEEVAKPMKIPFLVVPRVQAKAVPKRFFNGICMGASGSNTCFTDPAAIDDYAAFLSGAGVRSVQSGSEALRAALKQYGVTRFPAPYPYIANGYTVTPREGANLKPADEKFMPYEAKWSNQVARGTCPIAVYREKTFFRTKMLPELKEALKGSCGLEANWEPNGYYDKGCGCNDCRDEFAKYCKLPVEDVAKDWPKCVMAGGRYADKRTKFRAWQHGRVMKTLHKYICAYSGGEKSEGLIPELVWMELADAKLEVPQQAEMDSHEYMGELRWANPWGPYCWYDAQYPYVYQKRLPVASYAVAKNVRDYVDREYGRGKLKITSFPSGWQGKYWFATPEWIALAMDSFFYNGWEGNEVYHFPSGYDARYWQAYVAMTERAARGEDYVIDGTRTDELTTVEIVAEYAAPCREATGFMPQVTQISTLQTPSYDFKGGRLIGAINYWEKGAAFFKLKLKGLHAGDYTVVSQGRTLWTRANGGVVWSAQELAEKGIFVGVGAARTVDFEIRPAHEHAERAATEQMSVRTVKAAYERLKPRLAEEAAKDRAREAKQGLLYPDTLPEI